MSVPSFLLLLLLLLLLLPLLRHKALTSSATTHRVPYQPHPALIHPLTHSQFVRLSILPHLTRACQPASQFTETQLFRNTSLLHLSTSSLIFCHLAFRPSLSGPIQSLGHLQHCFYSMSQLASYMNSQYSGKSTDDLSPFD